VFQERACFGLDHRGRNPSWRIIANNRDWINLDDLVIK